MSRIPARTTFQKTEAETKLMASFIAQFVREGIVYVVIDNGDYWEVETTGGF